MNNYREEFERETKNTCQEKEYVDRNWITFFTNEYVEWLEYLLEKAEEANNAEFLERVRRYFEEFEQEHGHYPEFSAMGIFNWLKEKEESK